MLGTLVAVQAGQSLSTDGVGRDHALDSVGHGQIAVLSHQLAVLDLLQAANVLAVGDVELLLGLLAGQNSLITVDDNNEIAAVHVGGIIDLLLAAQQNSGLSSDVAQALAGSVEQVPLTLDFSGLAICACNMDSFNSSRCISSFSSRSFVEAVSTPI